MSRRSQYEDVSRARALEDPAEPAPPAPALDAIYSAEFDYVWRSLRRLGARPSDLEDLAHEVFLVVHRRLGDFDSRRPVRPWLFGISYRVVADYRRKASYRREIADDSLDPVSGGRTPEQAAAANEARALVMDALATLDFDRRAVFVLHDIDGYSAPDIAEAVGAPVNTVYSRLRIARKRFEAAVRRLARGDAHGGEEGTSS